MVCTMNMSTKSSRVPSNLQNKIMFKPTGQAKLEPSRNRHLLKTHGKPSLYDLILKMSYSFIEVAPSVLNVCFCITLNIEIKDYYKSHTNRY